MLIQSFGCWCKLSQNVRIKDIYLRKKFKKLIMMWKPFIEVLDCFWTFVCYHF